MVVMLLYWSSCSDLCQRCSHFSNKVDIKQNKPIWIHKPPVHCGLLPISEAKSDCPVKRLTQSSIRWWFILSEICCVADLSQVSHALGVSTILKKTRWMIQVTLPTFLRQPVVCQEASRLCWYFLVYLVPAGPIVESTSLEIYCLYWWPTSTTPTTLVIPYHPFYPQLYHRHSIRTKYGTLDWVRRRKGTPEVFKRLDCRSTMGCTGCWNFIQYQLTAQLL